MPIFNIEHIKITNRAIIPSRHLFDAALSLEAKGLLTLILSQSEGDDFSAEACSSLCVEGEAEITAILDELKRCGYVRSGNLHNSQ